MKIKVGRHKTLSCGNEAATPSPMDRNGERFPGPEPGALQALVKLAFAYSISYRAFVAPSLEGFQETVAVVTGGASGIGRACARTLSKPGADGAVSGATSH